MTSIRPCISLIRAFLTTTGALVMFQAAPQQASPQTSGSVSNAAAIASPTVQLKIEVIKSPTELAAVFRPPLVCDSDGNLYLSTDPDGVDGIHKLNAKGERVSLFLPRTADVKVNHPLYFSIGPDGDLYQLISAMEPSRYVFVYKSDGNLKSTIKLQPGFSFVPQKVAAFPSGDLLVSGLEFDKDPNGALWPFTGIFSNDGMLRKELTLKDDTEIHDMGASGDPKVTSARNPSANHAISGGAAETGPDGNVYLMRRLSPAILYAISAGGAVVRRFKVDPGSQDFMPFSMHISGNRIAVLFRHSQTAQEIIKVVDLQGRDVATYEEPVIEGRKTLGGAFACYSSNPDRFTFLKALEDHKLGLVIATAQ
jgi:hypothetical protein